MTDQPPRHKRRIIIVIGFVLLAVSITTGLSIYSRYFGEPRRFAVVREGVLYRSAQPTVHQIEHLIDKIGLRGIVIFREGTSQRFPNEFDYTQNRGLNVLHVPAKSRQPIPKKQVEEFFRFIDDPANHPVLVHCSAGRHRTGYLCALYRIERQGWTVKRAVEDMLSFEPDMDPNRPELLQLKQYERTVQGNDAAP